MLGVYHKRFGWMYNRRMNKFVLAILGLVGGLSLVATDSLPARVTPFFPEFPRLSGAAKASPSAGA